MKKRIDINTGVYDENLNHLELEDKVSLFGMIGEVDYSCGAYGISFTQPIDWDLVESKILEVTGCDNNPCFCCNDNFISFWELMWNFNCEDNHCTVVKLIS